MGMPTTGSTSRPALAFEEGLERGLRLYRSGDMAGALAAFEVARRRIPVGEAPPDTSPPTRAYIASQLAVEPSSRPATRRSQGIAARNLAALAEVDPGLARQIGESPFPEGLEVIDLWGKLRLYDRQRNVVPEMSRPFLDAVDPIIRTWTPLGLARIGSGQELLYLLARRYDYLHGMRRIHYLFEADPGMVRMQLGLGDLREALRTRELVLLPDADRARRFFSRGRHPKPAIVFGHRPGLEAILKGIDDALDPSASFAEGSAHYDSTGFRARQRRIAAGEILPRVMVITSRWTTFLKHCARDFLEAFEDLGCETSWLIEEADVESLTPSLLWDCLNGFRPDMIFTVSHARPTFERLPRRLPMVGFIQDKCGPILHLPELGHHIGPLDLFICMLGELRNYLAGKGVPAGQMTVMPIPADERVFFPLPAADPRAEAYRCDTSLVKHGHGDPDDVFRGFLREVACDGRNDEVGEHDGARLREIFTGLYREVRRDPARRWSDPEMEAWVTGRAGGDEGLLARVRPALCVFSFRVYSASFRCHLLEALSRSGIELRLYGKGWECHPQLARHARGPVGRGEELNAVYNHSRVNLQVHHSTTMHQRLVEGALAGGFFLVCDHDEACDAEPVRRYFEADREVVLFRDAEGMVDRCRYFLAHPEERQAIARRMRERALAHHTVRRAARTIIDLLRERLGREV